MARATWLAAGLVGCLLPLVGCGPQPPARFPATGTVRYAGNPVPAGYIVFSPDGSRGNSGLGTQADIKDGRYTLLVERGTVGGPHVAAVWAYDGQPILVSGVVNPNGKTLVAGYQVNIDLPQAPAELDFDLPAAAGAPAR